MSRTASKVRKNPDYIAATRWLDENGYAHKVEPPRRLGHPMLRVTVGDKSFRYALCSTPGPRLCTGAVIAGLKRRIAALQA